jgi:DNA replicative helicase MCM subunit Mcm2 (Cdc46/Mcm family)
MNVLITKMSDDYGVSPEKTEEIVRKLVQKGAIYEPQTGHYKSLL